MAKYLLLKTIHFRLLTFFFLGKPMRPNGPLEVSDVKKEGCTLKWKKPDDDGGSPIEYYEIEKMDTETGMWVPAGRSDEPKFEVKNLTPGKNYKFRVRAVNKEGDSDELTAEKAILAKNPFGNCSESGFLDGAVCRRGHIAHNV